MWSCVFYRGIILMSLIQWYRGKIGGENDHFHDLCRKNKSFYLQHRKIRGTTNIQSRVIVKEGREGHSRSDIRISYSCQMCRTQQPKPEFLKFPIANLQEICTVLASFSYLTFTSSIFIKFIHYPRAWQGSLVLLKKAIYMHIQHKFVQTLFFQSPRSSVKVRNANTYTSQETQL